MAKYKENDTVICVKLTQSNVEGLVVGHIYRVVGEENIMGTQLYAVSDGNNTLYAPDLFKKIEKIETQVKQVHVDNINHPPHYNKGKYEAIDILADVTKELSGIEAVCVGNILKYIIRYKYKNGIDDLNKANWYLNKLIGENSLAKSEVAVGLNINPNDKLLSKLQIGYIAGLTVKAGLDRYNLPSQISPQSNYKMLTVTEASALIEDLLAINSYLEYCQLEMRAQSQLMDIQMKYIFGQ